MLLLAVAGCKQILGLDEGSIAKDAPLADVLVDMPIDESACKDADADGVCNDVDRWPCGPEPADLPQSVLWEITENNDRAAAVLDGATLDNERKLVVTPGQMVTLRTMYAIIDCICIACLDQIEVGFAPVAGRRGCIYNGNPAGSAPGECMNPTTGNAQLVLAAPTTPGAYTLRFRIGQDLQCGTQTTWWDNTEPPPSAAAVHLCVVAP